MIRTSLLSFQWDPVLEWRITSTPCWWWESTRFWSSTTSSKPNTSKTVCVYQPLLWFSIHVWHRGRAVYLWSRVMYAHVSVSTSHRPSASKCVLLKNVYIFRCRLCFAVRATSRSLLVCSTATTSCQRSWKRNRGKSELRHTRRPAVCSPWVSHQLSSLFCSSKAL